MKYPSNHDLTEKDVELLGGLERALLEALRERNRFLVQIQDVRRRVDPDELHRRAWYAESRSAQSYLGDIEAAATAALGNAAAMQLAIARAYQSVKSINGRVRAVKNPLDDYGRP